MQNNNFKETEIGLIPEDWDINTLDNLCDITSSKRIFHKEYVSHGVPFYRSKEIILLSKNKSINTSLFIPEEKYKAIESKFGAPMEGDLLMTSVGTLGVPYIVNGKEKFYFKDGNLMWFRSFKENILNKYLLYWISSKIGQQKLDSVAIGSTQKALTIKSLKKIKIPIPPFLEQQAIVDILDNLDKKIHLNHQVNKTLEEISLEIFRHWFVYFEFPDENDQPYKSRGGEMIDSELGEIPSGWEVKNLKDTSNIIMGQSPKSVFYNEDGEGLPFHQGVTNFEERFPTDKIYCTLENKIAEHGDILFSVRAPVGRINIAKSKMIIGRGISAIRHKNEFQSFLLYQLKNIFTEEDSIGRGTVFNAITRKDLDDLKVIVPNKELDKKFNDFVSKMDNQIESLTLESVNLSQIRDSILPKLISGKIRVSEMSKK